MNKGPRWERVGSRGAQGRWLSLGSGPGVALLASPLAPAECYLPTARRLAQYARTHLIEMPGCGRSERLAAPWSLGDYAGWAADRIAERGLGRPAIVGHSYAGAVAIAVAGLYPQRLGALVVADATGAGAPASLGQAIRGAAADIVLDFGLVASMWHLVARSAAAHWRNNFALVREALRMDVTRLARRVTAPTLLAWGARDYTLPLWAGDVLAGCLPQARRYVSLGGSHVWVVSRPEEFARAVADFLGRPPSPPRRGAAADSVAV